MEETFKLKLKRYCKSVLVSIDQLINAVLGGYPDETFSSRVYRKSVARQKFWEVLHWIIDKMFFWEENHCYNAYKNELSGKYSPNEIKNNSN